MTSNDPCPTRADYEAMLGGRTDDDRAAVLEAHLEGCPACQRVLDGITVDERLTGALRRGPAPDLQPPSDPSLGAMVARLEDMAQQFTPAGYDLSVSGLAASGPEPVGEPVHMTGYRIVRLLGAGGMGLVYLADDEALRREVAIKVLRPRLARHLRAREGFLREARAMAALKHDNVVTVFQVGEAHGPNGDPVPFLAMERLEGETLADWVRREGALPPEWVARIGYQAAEGLAAAHARGVVHRDIKPGNLWLEAPPGWADVPPGDRPPLPAVARVKILDFGLAQPAGEEESVKSHLVLGTPAYMSPEQASGHDVDARADLFSLGVVLYELLTNRLPFPRSSRKSVPTYPAPEPLAKLVPGAAPALVELVHQLLATEPVARPSSARDVVARLASLVLPDGHPSGSMGPGGAAPPLRARGARRAALALAGVAVIAGAIVALTTRSADEALIPSGPPDEAWVRAVAALPPDRMTAAVIAKLKELNPGFDGQVARLGVSEGKVTEFGILTDEVSDIRPVRAFGALKHLTVVGLNPGSGKLSDLSPIRGLPLTTLNVWQNPGLADLTPATGMSLTLFQSGDTAIRDLSPLAGMPLDLVAINNCAVRDLSPVRSMPRLRYLRCDGCPIESLGPLAGSSVRELKLDFDSARGDLAVLERVPQLIKINWAPAAEFLARHSVP